MIPQKPRILIIGGIIETVIHPIPPVADGAPEWNVFRLAEQESSLDIHVVSPCQEDQIELLRSFPAHGSYHHIVIPKRKVRLYRQTLRHWLPLRIAVRRLARLPDLMSWWYLLEVKKLLLQLSPDLVIINGYPQFIRYLRPWILPGLMLLFMRYPLGESRRYLPLLDGIIVNSHGMRDYAAQLVNKESVPIWWMPNTLGDEFAVPPPLSKTPDNTQTQIVFAGRIIPEKGVLELVKAFHEVYAKLPGSKLVIYGTADQRPHSDAIFTSYEEEVRKLADELPPGAVEFAGYVPNREMGSLYRQSKLAVFPSVYLESFGMVALEAMRSHLPVIASRRPGFEELVIPGQTGLLVDDPTDIPSLADAMLEILSDPEKARQMGEAGYQRSLLYKPEIAIRKLEEILIPILTNKSHQSAGGW